jgi:uncharacterized protein (TIGR02246 family)
MTSNDTAAVQAGPDSAIRAVFDEVATAWEKGDTDAFVARYADDATAILPGFYLPGKDAIRTSMAAAFAGGLKGSRRIHEIRSIRHLGDGTAIVITDSTTLFPGEGGVRGEARPGAEQRERATWVLSGRDGRWLIEAYHGCPEQAA